MRQFEDRLRAELRRVDTATTATKETMLARVARARRRRTVAAGVGAVAGCALALTIIVPILGRGGLGDTAATEPRLIHEGRLMNVVFTDATHGYALQERCSMLHPDDIVNPRPQETPDVQSRCEAKLFATADAGASWEERTLPAQPVHKDAGVELVMGHSMMLWVPAPGTVALGSSNRRYWTTTDGGVSWLESPSPYPLGPPGSYGVFGPGDQHAFLASPPPGVGAKSPVVAAEDGSFWMRCESGTCVRVTRDQGVSWDSLPLGQPGTTADWVATADGQTVFAEVWDGVAATLVRSADGGRTWQPVPGLSMAFRNWTALALPNDDLILNRAGDGGGLFKLAAGSTTLQRLAGAPAHANPLYATGGWLVAATAFEQRETPELGNLAHVSPDGGATWIPVPQP